MAEAAVPRTSKAGSVLKDSVLTVTERETGHLFDVVQPAAQLDSVPRRSRSKRPRASAALKSAALMSALEASEAVSTGQASELASTHDLATVVNTPQKVKRRNRKAVKDDASGSQAPDSATSPEPVAPPITQNGQKASVAATSSPAALSPIAASPTAASPITALLDEAVTAGKDAGAPDVSHARPSRAAKTTARPRKGSSVKAGSSMKQAPGDLPVSPATAQVCEARTTASPTAQQAMEKKRATGGKRSRSAATAPAPPASSDTNLVVKPEVSSDSADIATPPLAPPRKRRRVSVRSPSGRATPAAADMADARPSCGSGLAADTGDEDASCDATPLRPPKAPTKKSIRESVQAAAMQGEFPPCATRLDEFPHIARELAAPSLPNLGYACLNMKLRDFDVFCSRDMIRASFHAEGGMAAVSRLALRNARDVLPLVLWNAAHGIRFFRLSSCIFPWMSAYDPKDLPDFPQIAEALREAGEAARRVGQRITFHPSEFCKIAGEREDWTAQSVRELEVHSLVLDLMGFLPATAFNKINIHVGGVYGDKLSAMKRFAEVVEQRLSPNCRARLTVENDDRPSMYSVEDLMWLYRRVGIPIVFDFHHHKFCPGTLSEGDALRLALTTWPEGVRPVVHWSESQEGRRPHAHSDYVQGPIFLHGYEEEVDVMVEAKCKELAVLRYRQAVYDQEKGAVEGNAAGKGQETGRAGGNDEGGK